MKRSHWRGRILMVPLLVVGLITAVEAGTNAGFSASITTPRQVKDPTEGQSISITIEVQNAVRAKGGVITIRYDAGVFTFDRFDAGPLVAGMLTLPGTPILESDGLSTIQGGGTQLFGTPGSGRGVLGTMVFRVSGEVPVAGAHLSITSVQIQASSSDKDILSYELGQFGVSITKTVRYTLSGTVSQASGEPVVGATVLATRNRGAIDEQTITSLSGADGAYTMTAEPDTYLVAVVPPPTSTALKITRIVEPVRLTEDRVLDLVLDELFANGIFNLTVVRRHDAAAINWFTRFPGLNDVVQYRAMGQTTWQTARNPLASRATPAMLAALRTLNEAAIPIADASLDQLSAALGRTLTPEEVTLLQLLDEAMRTRRHLVGLTGLTADTEYEFTARSTSLNDQSTPLFQGIFQTRRAPDLRPLVGTALDIQPSPTTAAIRWFTNRPADTRVLIELLGTGDAVLDTVFEYSADEDGSQVHLVGVEELTPATRYRATIGSRMPDGDALVTSGLMTEDDVAEELVRIFRTRVDRPLRFVGPPRRSVGPEEIRLKIELNQPAWVSVEYDKAISGSAATYGSSVASAEMLDSHEIILSNLDPATEYQYRVTAYLPSAPEPTGDLPVNTSLRITTDPRGNEQWSRDLRFKTSSLADIQPPVIVKGPQVHWRSTAATIFWETDVPTTGTVFLGTWLTGSITLGTPDEYEIVDLGPDGKPQFSQVHRVTIPALERSTPYGYRIESTAGNGQKIVFDPLANPASAKLARVAQPPGGAGRFTTDLNPDTQWPVILSGPSIASKTHDTAVIEWSTDEPANSEVNFGIGGTDEAVTSGDDETSHKIVLTNLTPGTSYSYLVGSTDASGNGATESSEAAFTTNPELDLTAPRITEGPEVVYQNDRSATIRWTTDEDASTELEYGPTSSLGFVRTSSVTGQAHEITLTNLTADTEYHVQVASTDLSGNGPIESETIRLTTDAQADLDPPIVVLDSVAVTDVSAIITWTTDEMSNSYVEYGTDSTNLSANIGDPEDAQEHEITLTNLTPNTKYYFRAGSVDRANNPPGESDLDSLVTMATPDRTPPAVPTGLARVAGNRQVELTWTSVPELDLNGFSVYRRSGTADYTKVASGLRQSSYVDLNVTNGTTYVYRVTAIDRQNPPNESARSDSVTAVPVAAAAPSPPTGLTVDQGDDHLLPTFLFTNSSAVIAGGTLTYTIQVSSVSDFSNVTASASGLAQVGSSGTGQTSWQITRSLTEGETYYWRVRAVEGAQVGEFSATQQYAAREAVALPGDFDGNGAVEFDDFFLFVDAFGQPATGANAVYDLDADAAVGFGDFFLFVDNFGKTAAGKRWSATTEVDPRAVVSLQATGGGPADQGRVTLRVQAAELEAVKAFGLVLHYNPEAVELVRSEPGSNALLASQGGQIPLFQVLAQRPGEVAIGSGLTEGTPVSGDGLLAELTFQVIGSANDAWFEVVEALTARSASEVRRVGQVNGTVLRPQAFYLRANFPNPFNPTTTIEYGLAEATEVELTVYDVLGQRVRILVQSPAQAAGFYSAAWDGLDQAGRAVGTGVYFYRLQTSQFTRTQRMTLLK